MYKKFLAGLLSFTVCTSAIFPTFITAAETASPAVTAESAEAVQILPHKNMENIYNLTSWVKTPEIPTDAKVIESGSLGEKVTYTKEGKLPDINNRYFDTPSRSRRPTSAGRKLKTPTSSS